ncbi:MAG TPA: ATP-binding protein [Terriglobales bacterium]|nr:ATP-binding protein [Terriglobales bacterium]
MGRRTRIAGISLALLILVVVLFVPQAFSLRIHASPESTWTLFLLSALSFLAIVVLTFVLVRQIAKLVAERRANVLGAQFKIKLVVGALALSLTPVVCMFGFTYGLINRTLDKWFSQPVVTLRDDNQQTLEMLNRFVADNARIAAEGIAQSPRVRTLNADQVAAALSRRRATLAGGFARVFDAAGHALASVNVPPTARWHEYAISRAPIEGGGEVAVGMPIPPSITAQLARLAQDRDRYERLNQERRSLRLIYTAYLLLLTLAILFGATWMALYLSRLVTVPIGELAQATDEISRGNLAYRVRVSAHDEIGRLVDSFNSMAQQLQAANQELDGRRRYTEALLENTPSAVISLGADYSIERVNPAVQRLFGAPAHPTKLEELFDASSRREIQHLLRKSERWPAATGQIEVERSGRQLTLAVTAAAVAAGTRRGRFASYVLVLEDLTDLLRIQKTAAWREVAQRIAHEIKNPLTPIALSAQRIRRRLRAQGEDNQAVIEECATTIEAEAHSLQRLVDEFSAFARFPHAKLVASDLNEIIERALRAFDGRLDGIEIRTSFDTLPPLALDAEDMKRVFINLIDNAAEAMHGCPYRQLSLRTQALDGAVEAVVADTGRGLPPGDKQRLLLPYVSTKDRGSGLGLAIALRIVEENGGTLRVEDNTPLGARFIVEWPLPAE